MKISPERLCLLFFVLTPIVTMVIVRMLAGNVAYSDYEEERIAMVRDQIERRGIQSLRVKEAMLAVPRHEFVPEELVPYAYQDKPLPIGEDQTISQPYIVAFMTDAIQPRGNEHILEIGTGSGYQAAVLSKLCKAVYSVEIKPRLYERARETLESLEYDNILVRLGDGYNGWAEFAPYDAIIVTCAPSDIPPALANQLKEGGRMVIPVGEGYHQVLYVFEKVGNELVSRGELPVRFVPMQDIKGNNY